MSLTYLVVKMTSSDHTAKHEVAVAICGGWNPEPVTAKLRPPLKPEPVMVTVMSSLPAVAVGGDTELTIGVVGCVGTGEGRETVPDLSHAIAAS